MHLLEHRLGRAPAGIAVQKGQTVPDLVAVDMHRAEAPADQLKRQSAGTQRCASRQRLGATIECLVLTHRQAVRHQGQSI
jgi:hypothetical protein